MLRDRINLIFYSCATDRHCLESNTVFLAVNQEVAWKLHLPLPGPEKMGIVHEQEHPQSPAHTSHTHVCV